MKRVLTAVLFTLLVAGCGGGGTATETSMGAPATSAEATSAAGTAETTTAAASGCTAGGLDAMSALADFQLQMDDAQKADKLTVDQLVAARDTLFNETQAAQAGEDWAAYCRSIDDMRAELGL